MDQGIFTIVTLYVCYVLYVFVKEYTEKNYWFTCTSKYLCESSVITSIQSHVLTAQSAMLVR